MKTYVGLGLALLLLFSGCASSKEDVREDTVTFRVQMDSIITNIRTVSYSYPVLEKALTGKVMESSNGEAVAAVENGVLWVHFSEGNALPPGRNQEYETSFNGIEAYRYGGKIEVTMRKEDVQEPLRSQLEKINVLERSRYLFGQNQSVFLVKDYYNGTDYTKVGKEVSDVQAYQGVLNKLVEFENQMLQDETYRQFATARMKETGNASDPTTIAKAFHRYMVNHFEYEDKDLGADGSYNGEQIKSIAQIIQSGKGACAEFAFLYKALLDGYEIPNRLVFGNFHGKPDYINHVWNEVQINGSWVPVDNTAHKEAFGGDHYQNHVVVRYASY